MLAGKSRGIVLRVAVATACVGTIAFGPAASAQQQAAGPVSLGQIFDGDNSNPTADGAKKFTDAGRKASALGECPKARVKVVVEKGDPVFQAALAAARRDSLLQILDRAGLGANLFFFETDPEGAKSDVQIDYQMDREKPKLDTSSVPRKGTKVKAGDRITVTMVARDNANDWQTGIKTIQLVADSEGGRFIDVQNYLPTPGCHAPPMERRAVATYTVPANPPPIVRLTALAEDFVGLMDTDVGEFPTGEVWKGTIRLQSDARNPQCSAITSTAEYEIRVNGDGTVTGEGTFQHSGYTCPTAHFTAPRTDGTLQLVGKKEGSRFTVNMNDWNPKNGFTPRLPGGPQIVQIGPDGKAGEGTFSPGIEGVTFGVKLECRFLCGNR